VEAYENGAQVVFLDAPTGSGKTLIAELARRELDTRALYICTTKGLQDQFLADFPYARVLKGRANYPTELGPEEVTCRDCTGTPCMWCDDRWSCPYQIAKNDAIAAEVAVLNTAYLLAEANGPKTSFGNDGKGRAQFIIADECDKLEDSLMGHVEFATVGTRELEAIGKLTTPKKGSHKSTIARWLEEEYAPRLFEVGLPLSKMRHDIRQFRRGQRYLRNAEEALWVAKEYKPMAVEDDGDGEDVGSLWIRDYRTSDPERLILKPVVVDRYGSTKLWRHGRRWLLMSATIISPEEQAEALGLDQCGMRWESVVVPMTFPVENRPVIIAPVGKMTKRAMNDDPTIVSRVVQAVTAILWRHPGERVLVHTVSYVLARELKWELDKRVADRRVVTYANAAEREDAFDEYARTPGAVLLAPSMDRGFDFREDLARVVIIAKVPFPNLGDRQVSARLRLPERNGDWWYRVQTVRTIVQMTGRGVRGVDDHAVTYILDKEFGSNIYKKAKSLFPGWWREAVDMTFSVRELMKDVPDTATVDTDMQMIAGL
jgi:Rad3-related DNA helicase